MALSSKKNAGSKSIEHFVKLFVPKIAPIEYIKQF